MTTPSSIGELIERLREKRPVKRFVQGALGEAGVTYDARLHPSELEQQAADTMERLRDALTEALPMLEVLHSTAVASDTRKIVWRVITRGREALTAKGNRGDD